MNQHDDRDAYRGSPAENYERYFVPAIGAPAAAGLLELAALRPGERVLDVACGTGVVARRAADTVGANGQVAGVDINPGMLAVARATTPPGTTIEWREATAETLPFPDASFDAVLCQMGLQFMADTHAALSEMRRVLAPEGRLTLNVVGPTPPVFAIMAEGLSRHVGDDAAGFVQQVFSLHDTTDVHDRIDDVGFGDVRVQAVTRSLRLPPPEAFLWQYVYSTPLAGAVAQADDEHREALARTVVAQWQDFVDDGVLMLEVRMVVASART